MKSQSDIFKLQIVSDMSTNNMYVI